MFYSISGKLLAKQPDEAVVEAGGIGFKIAIPSSVFYTLPEIGDDVFLFTHFIVREDAFELYGFTSLSQCEYFRTIISVSGVGAKTGLAILSAMTLDSITLALSSNNYKAFTVVPGIGTKLAQRIVLELKDKITKLGYTASPSDVVIPEASSSDDDSLEALLALGFSRSEAVRALAKVDQSLPTGGKITAALRELSNGR